MRLCPWSLASSIPVLGLERVCPRKGCPWPWPRIFLCPWPRALCPRLHLCKKSVTRLEAKAKDTKKFEAKDSFTEDRPSQTFNNSKNSAVLEAKDVLEDSIFDSHYLLNRHSLTKNSHHLLNNHYLLHSDKKRLEM